MQLIGEFRRIISEGGGGGDSGRVETTSTPSSRFLTFLTRYERC